MFSIRHSIVSFFFFGHLLVPSTFFLLRISSSYSLGLGIVSIAVIALIVVSKKNVSVPNVFLFSILAYLIFITSHMAAAINSPTLWVDKFSYSVVLSILISLSAACAAKIAVYKDPNDFHIIIKRCSRLLLVIGFFGVLFGKAIGQFIDWRVPLPPFSEPSHFVIAAAPFALYLLASREWRLFYSFLILAISILIFTKSAVLVILLFILAFMRFPFVSGIFFLTSVAIVNLQIFLPEYYQARLIFWNGENLTALVYLQGWQIIIDSVVGENIAGYGFQQLGGVSFELEASQMIRSLLGRDSNTLGGGFVAAKIFGEFGRFAIPIVTILIFLMIKSYFSIRSHLRVKKVLLPTVLFAHCVSLGFVVEFFFRGIGYFSIGSAFMIFSLVVLSLNHTVTPLKPRSDARPK